MTSNLIEALSHATIDTGQPCAANLTIISYALSNVAGNKFLDGKISAVITPAFFCCLTHIDGFTKCLAVKNISCGIQYFSFAGVNWVVHGGLPGAGTFDEHCFMFHESAIESNNEGVFRIVDMKRVVRMRHDGSCFAVIL